MKNPEKIQNSIAQILCPRFQTDIVDKLYREKIDQTNQLINPQDSKA